jgi:anti-sigma regulatory factor (Ser/Thr protein kinase)
MPNMDEMLEVTLAGGRDAPRRARVALLGLNGSLAALRQPVSLLVSELVTNAVRHGGAGLDRTLCLKLDSTPKCVRVEVMDDGPGFQPPAAGAETPLSEGFGLSLVDQIADRWGVELSDGATVWFEIDRA